MSGEMHRLRSDWGRTGIRPIPANALHHMLNALKTQTLWLLVSQNIHVTGEYFVVGVDIEQYDPSLPDQYLRGMLKNKTERDAVVAFQSYLAVVPSPHVAFDRFSRLVSTHFVTRNFFGQPPEK